MSRKRRKRREEDKEEIEKDEQRNVRENDDMTGERQRLLKLEKKNNVVEKEDYIPENQQHQTLSVHQCRNGWID